MFQNICSWKCRPKNSRSKAVFSISRNQISLQFYVVNSYSCLIHVVSPISYEIMLKLTSFSLKIMKNGETENCHFMFHANGDKFILKSCNFVQDPLLLWLRVSRYFEKFEPRQLIKMRMSKIVFWHIFAFMTFGEKYTVPVFQPFESYQKEPGWRHSIFPFLTPENIVSKCFQSLKSHQVKRGKNKTPLDWFILDF